MKAVYSLLIIYITTIHLKLHAQSDDQAAPLWLDRWRESIEQGADIDEANVIYDQLSALQDHPINLNQATEHDLRKIPFLSEEQIESILFYQYTHNPIRTIYELKLVEQLDYETIQVIKPFLYVGEPIAPEQKSILDNYFNVSRTKITVRSEYNLNNKKGYFASDTTPSPYIGSPLGSQIRLELGNSRHFQTGISFRKSPGEELNGGITNPSIHLQLKDLNLIKKLVIGDFQAQFGNGLVINNGFSMGKNSALDIQNRSTNGINRSATSHPELAFRGLGITIHVGKSSISTFTSIKNIDATIENNKITSINRSGIYRTEKMEQNRNTAYQYTCGVHTSYPIKSVQVGTSIIYNQFNLPFQQNTKYYNHYFQLSQQTIHAGIDYSYRANRFNFAGETAIQQDGSLACSHQLQYKDQNDWTFRLHHRFFSEGYYNYWASSMSESNIVNCEQGFLIGIKGDLSKLLKIESYADLFAFNRPKNGIAASSNGWDSSIKLTYCSESDYQFVINYRYKEKDKNSIEELSKEQIPLPTFGHRIKGEAHYNINAIFLLRSYLEICKFRMEDTSPAMGSLLSQHIEWAPKETSLRMIATISLFNTDKGALPVYSRDRSSLYSFSGQSLSGQGIRLSSNIRYRPMDGLTLIAQYRRTEYFDKTTIGSSNEIISQNHKDDIYLTISYTIR